MKNTDKKTVFYLAWQFARQTGLSFSECLKKAWANIKLKSKMSTQIVRFYFQKVDGSTREAWGTLRPDLLLLPSITAKAMTPYKYTLIPRATSSVALKSSIYYLCKKNQKKVRKLLALSKIYRTFAVFKPCKVIIP